MTAVAPLITFTKTIQTPNGAAVGFHALRSIELRWPPGDTAVLTIASYATGGDYVLGRPPVWAWTLALPADSIVAGIDRTLAAWAILQAPFVGATLSAPAATDSVQAARDRQWQIISGQRSAEIATINFDAGTVAITTAVRSVATRSAALQAQLAAATTTDAIAVIVWS